MAPGRWGVGAVFACFSGEDSGQTGDATGELRVARRSRSHYLSNAPGLADQLVACRERLCARRRLRKAYAAYFCKVPGLRESELGSARYGSANRGRRGVFGLFEDNFPIRIPIRPDKILAIREFHVVHDCVFFPTCPGLRINLLRVRKTLCASVATSVGKFWKFQHSLISLALHRGELGFARYDLASRGRWNVPYAKGSSYNWDSGLTEGALDDPKVACGRLGSGCLVLHADTRENPVGKNGVMTHSLVVPNQKYDPHINRHRFPPKIFKNGTERRKARQIFSNVRVHLFVSTLVAIVRRVLSCQTKSMTFTLTDVLSAFTIKWLEKQVDPDPASKRFRMVALERKFDELLSFVQLIAKRNPDDENQRKEDDRDANNEELEGHSNTNTTPPRPPTPPKPEGKDSHMSWFPNMTMPPKFKAPEFEKYNGRGDPMIHLQMYCRKMAPYADNEPLLIQTFQDTLTGHAAEWYSQLKKISHLEGAGRYLLGSIRVQLPNSSGSGERIEDALKTKKIVDMTALMALAEQAAKKAPTKKKEGDVQMIGRSNGRPRQVLPTFTMQPIQPRPTPTPAPTQVPAPAPAPQIPARPVVPHPDREEPNLTCRPETLQRLTKKGFQPNSTCDFHFGEVGHTVENCNQLKHRVQDLIDHGVLEGARGHSLECCEEFKKEVANLMEKGLVKKEEIPSGGDCQSYDPSDLDWYAELNLDDIVEDEMDLDNLQDEGDDWGYFMEDDTDEWRNVDFTKLFQFPCLIVPPGFETPEFEIFYENGDPEAHLQKYGEKMALHLENELLMISVFPESLSKQAAAWKMEEPYVIPDPGVNEVIVEIKEESSMSSLPALTEGEEEEKAKPLPPAKDPDSTAIAKERRRANQDTTTKQHHHHHAEEEYAGPMVEGLSIHTIAEEEDSTTPPTRHCQQGEEAKMWTCVPLLQRVSSSNEITRKTSNDPHVSEIDNKTNCSLDNIDNSDEEIELPNDILEALERQDEGSKPNIEELEIINLADEGEEPREVKIGTRCTTEQKGGAHRTIKRVPRDLRLPEVILKIKEEVEKQLKAGFLSTVTYSDWVANIVPVPKKDGKQRNAVFSFMDGFSGYNQIKMAEEDKSKTAFVTHWGTFVYDVMPFGLKNAGATYQRAMVTLFHDMIHHEIEVYVDDMIAKSRTAQDHLTDLRKLFQRLKKYQLRLNPNKCAFGVTSGKLLGFIVSGRGIEIDPAKVQAIRSMPAPKTEKEIRSFLGRINYIARFIAQLTATCEPLFKLLRKRFQEASMGCMLGQQDETGKKEQAIYYLSKKFTGARRPATCCETAVGSGIGAVLVSPKGQQTPIAVKLGFDCTNNMTEYEACIVVSQTNGEWQARDPKLIPYQRYISRLVPKFKYITFTYTPRAHNHFADALATLASLIKLVEGDDVRPLRIETRDIPAYCVCVEECMNVEAEIDNKPWYYDIKRFIQDREYPPRATENEKKYIRRMAFQFFLSGEILYKRTHDATLLRCVDAEEANRLIQEMHAGLMGAHANGPFLAPEDYESWLLLVDNGEGLHQTCPNMPQMPDVSELQERTSPISPHYGLAMALLSLGNGLGGGMFLQECHSSRGHPVCEEQHYLPLRNARNAHHRQCFQPEQPHDGSAMPAVQDPAPQLCSIPSEDERSRRSCQQKREEDSEQDDWRHIKIGTSTCLMPLCAYRTSVRTSVGATPYSLVYGMEAVLPVEVEIPSLRILSQTQLEEAEWAQARYEQLNFIDEKRLAALCHGQLYQRRIERAYNKKARPRTFQPGDLVLKKRNMALSDSTRKVRTII
uniref:Reverse transcriptase domain-containing protein n=1 Tax=Fagus sylvatica TaxID=28930 RepID=A0A2N9IPD2_FAGSY